MRPTTVITTAALAALTLAGCDQHPGADATSDPLQLDRPTADDSGEPQYKGDEHGGGNGVPGGIAAPSAEDIRRDLREHPELRDMSAPRPTTPDVDTDQQRFTPDAAAVPEHIHEVHRQLGPRSGSYAVCSADDSGHVVNYWPASEWGWKSAVEQCQNPWI